MKEDLVGSTELSKAEDDNRFRFRAYSVSNACAIWL